MQPAQSVEQLFQVPDSFGIVKKAVGAVLVGVLYSYIFKSDPKITVLALVISNVAGAVLRNLACAVSDSNRQKFWNCFVINTLHAGLNMYYLKKLDIVAMRGVYIMGILQLISTIYILDQGKALVANG